MVVMADFAFIRIYRSKSIPSCRRPLTVMAMGELPSLYRISNSFVDRSIWVEI